MRVRELFDTLDSDGNGELTPQELRRGLIKMTQPSAAVVVWGGPSDLLHSRKVVGSSTYQARACGDPFSTRERDRERERAEECERRERMRERMRERERASGEFAALASNFSPSRPAPLKTQELFKKKKKAKAALLAERAAQTKEQQDLALRQRLAAAHKTGALAVLTRLEELMRARHMTTGDVFRALDADGNGDIDVDEFGEVSSPAPSPSPRTPSPHLAPTPVHPATQTCRRRSVFFVQHRNPPVTPLFTSTSPSKKTTWLRKGLVRLGGERFKFSKGEVRALVDFFDDNGDGSIEHDEFDAVIKRLRRDLRAASDSGLLAPPQPRP